MIYGNAGYTGQEGWYRYEIFYLPKESLKLDKNSSYVNILMSTLALNKGHLKCILYGNIDLHIYPKSEELTKTYALHSKSSKAI